jgi:DNA-binding transcriptional ArsR family regulator
MVFTLRSRREGGREKGRYNVLGKANVRQSANYLVGGRNAPRVRPKRGAAAVAFEIWQADGKVASVDSPVRLGILHELERGPATLGTLVKATGKAKSTLSTLHIRPLVRAGLVAQAADPKDARVKWYTLRAQRLGSSAVDAAQLRQAVLGYAQGAGLLPLRDVLAILDVGALAGAPAAYADPVADRLGAAIGRMLGGAADPIGALDALLRREGLGSVDAAGRVTAAVPAAQAVVERIVRAALDAHA